MRTKKLKKASKILEALKEKEIDIFKIRKGTVELIDGMLVFDKPKEKIMPNFDND